MDYSGADEDAWLYSVPAIKLLLCDLGRKTLPSYLCSRIAFRAHFEKAHDERGRHVVHYLFKSLCVDRPVPTQYNILLERLYSFTSIRQLLCRSEARKVFNRCGSLEVFTRWLLMLEDVVTSETVAISPVISTAFENKRANDCVFIDDTYDYWYNLMGDDSDSDNE